MILDSHCHAWRYWPYQPAVPDPESRGIIQQLLHEMQINQVDQALLVCAQIDHNPDNNAYIAGQVVKYPNKFYQLVDLDSEWSGTYHTPGAAKRLREVASQWPIQGFTHYLRREEDASWLYSEDGKELFRTAAELGLIASISCYPHQQAAIRQVAVQVPQLPILCHHMGHPRLGRGSIEENLAEILLSAEQPNIFLKLSGFSYLASQPWEYPFEEVRWTIEAIYDRFGAQRLCWGSDYPVVRFNMTYRHALEAFRTHCNFVSSEDQEWILAKTLLRLLNVEESKP